MKPDWLHEAVISRDSAGKIAGSMLVLIKRFPPPMKSFLYSPRGPVWDYRNMDVLWEMCIRDSLSGIGTETSRSSGLHSRQSAKEYRLETDMFVSSWHQLRT